MKRPIKPRAPSKPKAPKKIIETFSSKAIDRYHIEYKSFDHIIREQFNLSRDHIIDFTKVKIDDIYCCESYGDIECEITISYDGGKIENTNYDKELDKYNCDMIKYKEKYAAYKQKIKAYGDKMKEYEKFVKEEEIAHAKKILEKYDLSLETS